MPVKRAHPAEPAGSWLAWLACAACAVCIGCAPATGGDESPACSDSDSDPGTRVSYAAQIRPLLQVAQNGASACTYCHTPTIPEASTPVYLSLDSYANLRKGGKLSGARVVVPGKPCSSLLLMKLRGTTGAVGERMPRGGPYFTSAQLQLVSDWIAEGASGEDPK